MIGVHYESYGGGKNNVAVATDSKTGEFSTSLVSKENALRALKRKLTRRCKAEGGG